MARFQFFVLLLVIGAASLVQGRVKRLIPVNFEKDAHVNMDLLGLMKLLASKNLQFHSRPGLLMPPLMPTPTPTPPNPIRPSCPGSGSQHCGSDTTKPCNSAAGSTTPKPCGTGGSTTPVPCQPTTTPPAVTQPARTTPPSTTKAPPTTPCGSATTTTPSSNPPCSSSNANPASCSCGQHSSSPCCG